MTTQRPEKNVYTIQEAVEYTGIGTTTLRALIKEGKCKVAHIRTRIIISKAELDRLIEQGA